MFKEQGIPSLCPELWSELSSFVEEVCRGRDESHGHLHMKAVAERSLELYLEDHGSETANKEIIEKIAMAAWLHDVADHKYDKEGKLGQKLTHFLSQKFKDPNSSQQISSIIERVSYSKENKAKVAKQPLDWEEVLGQDGLLIRNYVSDADKLEALGHIGMQRCLEYAQELTGSKDPLVLLNHLETHAQEKLFRLKDEFIRTPAGKKRAEKLHTELEEGIKEHKGHVERALRS